MELLLQRINLSSQPLRMLATSTVPVRTYKDMNILLPFWTVTSPYPDGICEQKHQESLASIMHLWDIIQIQTMDAHDLSKKWLLRLLHKGGESRIDPWGPDQQLWPLAPRRRWLPILLATSASPRPWQSTRPAHTCQCVCVCHTPSTNTSGKGLVTTHITRTSL